LSILVKSPDAFWMTEEGIESATIEFELPRKRTFDCLMLQVNIRVGQRRKIEGCHRQIADKPDARRFRTLQARIANSLWPVKLVSILLNVFLLIK